MLFCALQVEPEASASEAEEAAPEAEDAAPVADEQEPAAQEVRAQQVLCKAACSCTGLLASRAGHAMMRTPSWWAQAEDAMQEEAEAEAPTAVKEPSQPAEGGKARLQTAAPVLVPPEPSLHACAVCCHLHLSELLHGCLQDSGKASIAIKKKPGFKPMLPKAKARSGWWATEFCFSISLGIACYTQPVLSQGLSTSNPKHTFHADCALQAPAATASPSKPSAATSSPSKTSAGTVPPVKPAAKPAVPKKKMVVARAVPAESVEGGVCLHMPGLHVTHLLCLWLLWVA